METDATHLTFGCCVTGTVYEARAIWNAFD